MFNYVQTDNIATRRDMNNVQLRTNRQHSYTQGHAKCSITYKQTTLYAETKTKTRVTAKLNIQWKPLKTVDKTKVSNKRE